MITLKEVKTNKDLKDFVKFPFKLYKDSKYWVPPIIKEEMKVFDENENPVFNNAEAHLFLAYKNNTIVGRIAAIINWLEVKEQGIKKMRFGWFDFIDDLEVSKALLNKVEAIGKANNLDYTEGPVGFSNLDKVGVMTEGFDTISTMIGWYNHDYYVKHYQAANYSIEKSFSESQFSVSNVNPEMYIKVSEVIKKRYQVKALGFSKTKDVMPYVDKMFDLFNTTYASLSSFVAITDIQKAYFKKKFISFINPEYIKFVLDKNNDLIGFAIVLPGYAKALQKAKGKLLPFGFWHLLQAKKHSKEAVFYLIGIHPDYQNKGIHAIIFEEYHKVFKSKGIETCIRTPELDDNYAIKQIWKHFNSTPLRKRKTFKKNL